MFLDLLTFFGTFVTAAILIQKFAPDKAYRARFLVGVLTLALAFETFAFKIPFRSAWLELLYILIGTAVLALVIWTSGLGPSKSSRSPSDKTGSLFLLIIPFFPIVSFTLVGRVHHAQKLAVKIDGIIWLKFHSSDHNAKSIAIRQIDGSTTTIEGVDEETWNQASPEKSHLIKPAWSATAQLDGKEVRVVPKAYVTFLGPFQD